MTIPTKCAIWQSSVDSVASFSDPFYIPRNKIKKKKPKSCKEQSCGSLSFVN